MNEDSIGVFRLAGSLTRQGFIVFLIITMIYSGGRIWSPGLPEPEKMRENVRVGVRVMEIRESDVGSSFKLYYLKLEVITPSEDERYRQGDIIGERETCFTTRSSIGIEPKVGDILDIDIEVRARDNCHRISSARYLNR